MSVVGKEQALVQEISRLLIAQKKTVAVAESCTGGNIASMLTSVPGSSAFFEGGVIAYSNKVKIYQLQVELNHIVKHSAVSDQVAKEMADGIRLQLQSDFAVSTTGYAGPGGDKVGQVFIAFSSKEVSYVVEYLFEGDRKAIIDKTSFKALSILASEIKK